MRTYRGQKPMKSEMREYLIKNKELSTETAERFGWKKLAGYIFEFRRDGMNIQTDTTNKNNTIYRLVEDGLQIIDAETQENQKQEYELQPEDMRIKTSMKEVILDHLKKHKNITSSIAMKKYKCLNLSAIIKKLKDEGWKISRTETRGNNDYNIASNRNNAYSIYTLEKKSKTKSIYTIHCLHERCMDKLIPVITEEFNTFDEARNYCRGLAENLIADCNTLFGTSLTRFEIVILPETIQVMKKEIIKKLFKKTEKSTLLASFCTLPRMVEVL